MRIAACTEKLAALALVVTLAACSGGVDTNPHEATSGSGSNGSGNGSNGNGNNGGGGGAGTITGGGTGSTGGIVNDGATVPTYITNNGTALTGHFTCTEGAQLFGNVTTAVGTNGLIGNQLTSLLNTLGATTVTQLLNSITNPNNVIDDNLDTYASVSLTAGLLGGSLDSVDESVLLPTGTTASAGNYAVFAVSFPQGTANLSLLNTIVVSTYLNNSLQESNTLNQSALTLLGTAGGSSPAAAFIGVQTTKSFDRATIEITPGVLSVNVGDAMHINELCVGGTVK